MTRAEVATRAAVTPRVGAWNGFAAVTALLILAAIATLAVGGFFLTMTNLRLAENARTQAVARYNAEKWLDVALIIIADGYVELRALPTRAELNPFLINDLEYEITRYSVNPEKTVGEIQVTGRALRGDGSIAARHPVSARFQGVTSARNVAGPGFITPGSISVDGASTLLLNMHAGRSLVVGGNIATEDPITGQLYTYMSGSGDCKLGTAGGCLDGQDPPVVDAVDWNKEYSAAWTTLCGGAANREPPSSDGIRSIDNVAVGAVLCLGENLVNGQPVRTRYEINGNDLRGVTIVGGPNTTVTLRAGSRAVEPPDTTLKDLGVRVIAGDVLLTADNTMRDRNEIVARGNVVLDRAVTKTEEVNAEGRTLTVVKTVIKAGNDVVFAGSGTSGTFAEVTANGKFCRSGNGGALFVGSITAAAGTPNGTLLTLGNHTCPEDRNAIDFRGGGGWVARLPDAFDTGGEPQPVPTGITIVARRP
jgi:hypothetical protein